MVELLHRFDNLVVLRTLSKALAYAGARCGSVIAASSVIEMLDAVQAPYALATPVIECVENALESDSLEITNAWISEIVEERERMMTAIRTFPFVRRIWPSSANFFLIEIDAGSGLLQQSTNDGILLRFLGGDLTDCIRITVGTAAENNRLLQTFDNLQGS